MRDEKMKRDCERKAALEDRKHGFQLSEELGRGQNARLQPQRKRAEEPLPDASDIRLCQTTVRMAYPEKKRNKKSNKKYVSRTVILLWPATNRERHIRETTG